LNNASNVSVNFNAAFVANGEEPAPGIFSSTATVMLSYE
jgi:type 1 fimbria pilin